jgi:hypothetical protein
MSYLPNRPYNKRMSMMTPNGLYKGFPDTGDQYWAKEMKLLK